MGKVNILEQRNWEKEEKEEEEGGALFGSVNG